MPNGLVVSVDIDDVLANCSIGVRTLYEREFGVELGDAMHYETAQAYPEIGPEGHEWFSRAYRNPEIMGNLEPTVQAHALMMGIQKSGIPFIYCSHRPSSLGLCTHSWLERNNFPIATLIVGSDSKINLRQSKERPMVFIDDSAQVLNRLTELGRLLQRTTRGICINMPHNVNVSLDVRVTRCASAEGVLALIECWQDIFSNV